jgi:transposase
MTPAQAAGLVVRRPEQRTASERRVLVQLGEVHPDLRAVLAHFASFAALVRQWSEPCPTAPWEPWTARAIAGGVPALKACATNLRQDGDAVVAALTLPYSQGHTQGPVNRLKLLKRSRYGRANFDLVRGRVLYASAAARYWLMPADWSSLPFTKSSKDPHRSTGQSRTPSQWPETTH